MNIYVGNLSFSTGEDSLRALFDNFGEVDEVKMIMDRATGRPRGFAFVTMPNDDEANTAISELDGTEFEGRSLKVNEAKPREPRSGGGGGGFRGGRGGGGGGGRGGYGGGGGGGGRGGYGGGGGYSRDDSY
ncbi:RNA recognition motif domain-containing protein [Poriferisphaera sp. WC338]|uniref:RNA recognition motif domain-containing protein n=1 Tax=Poriferisphaera sp. WC338 TaxID=3425129 RepID=UPI003D818469